MGLTVLWRGIIQGPGVRGPEPAQIRGALGERLEGAT